VQKTIDLAREAQSKHLYNYNGDLWAKAIKTQQTAMTKKHGLEEKIVDIKKDMIRVNSLIKKGGRIERQSRKTIQQKPATPN